MSGQYGQKKKQPRGGPSGNYPLRQRPTKNQEKSVLSDGIYKNELFMFNALSVIGSTVKIWVNNGRIYEGIFRTFNAGLEMVVDNVHVVEGSKLPCKENIIPHMVFQWKDIVNMNLPDVNLDYAILGSDGCADASASGRHNGRSGERELQPWVNTDEFSELEALDESNSNGWPANSMFEANETKFNYKSKYDPSLKEYTTELHRVDTDEYRTREAEAERHAQEIQSSLTYSENADLENGDEEMLFSAVHRPDESAAVTATGNGGKFIVPQHRSAQTGAVLAQRPQKLVVLPSTQTDVVRSHHPSPAIVPTAAVETAAEAVAISSSSGVIRINAGEARKEEIDRPLAPTSKPALGSAAAAAAAAAFEHMTDKPKISIVNVVSTNAKTEPQKPRADAIQELKEFRVNFKLPDAASEPKEPKHPVSQTLLTSQTVPLAPSMAVPVALPQSQLPPHTQVASQQMALEPNHRGFQEERSEANEDVKDDVSKKSVLNPSAKEFVPAVRTYQAPRNLASQTPPRPPSTVGSPVFMPYIQPNTPVYHTTIMPPPPSIQQPRSAGVANKRASVSVSARPDANPPPPQAMTGAPLITQQVMISGPTVVPGGLTMMPVHQPVIRMLPQHHQNVMIDPNQPMFALPMASSLTSHQPPHPGAGLGAATHHVIAGGALTSAMHASHGAAGIAVAPPPPSQQTSGAPTPTPVHQYGQPLQPGSTMTLSTTSGTPQSPAQIQMFPGAPGGPLAMSHHPQQIHPVSLQHINNPTSPIIYQTPGGLVQFPHQAPGLAYATAGPGGQQPGLGQQQPMAGPHQQPPPAMGPSSHVVMHGPQMVMGPQGQGAYMGMPVPGAMTQTPGFAQHPVAAFHMYSVPGAGPTFSFTPQ